MKKSSNLLITGRLEGVGPHRAPWREARLTILTWPAQEYGTERKIGQVEA